MAERIFGIIGTLTGNTTLVSKSGSNPTLTTVSPADGPTSGGTFNSSDGTVTVDGTNLGGADRMVRRECCGSTR